MTTRKTQPTVDEQARADANKLQIAVTGAGHYWQITTAGNRNVIRLPASETRWLTGLIHLYSDDTDDDDGDEGAA